MAYRQWRIRGVASIGRIPLNDEIYSVTDEELGPIGNQNDTERNARLLCRELISNIAIHDKSAQRVSLTISKTSTNQIKIVIVHDGNTTDYLASNSPCAFILQTYNHLNASHQYEIDNVDRQYTISI